MRALSSGLILPQGRECSDRVRCWQLPQHAWWHGAERLRGVSCGLRVPCWQHLKQRMRTRHYICKHLPERMHDVRCRHVSGSAQFNVVYHVPSWLIL